MDIEDNLKLSLLSEIYKNLLTVKQQKMLKDFLDNNLSISELATEYKTTRQAVNDLLKRTFKTLNLYEQKLGLLKKFQAVKGDISQVVNEINNSNFNKQEVINKLNKILEVL